MEELAIALRDAVPVWKIVLGAGGLLGGAGVLASMAVPQLLHRILPSPQTERLADHIPFHSVLEDGRTIRCDDGTLVATILLSGASTAALPADQRRERFQQRCQLLEMLPEDMTLRIVQRRGRERLPPPLQSEQSGARRLLTAWDRQFELTASTSHALVLSLPGNAPKARERLDDVCERIAGALGAFAPRSLEVDLHDPMKSGELLSWWADRLHPLVEGRHDLGSHRTLISERLGRCHVTIDPDGLLCWTGADRTTWGMMLSFARWSDTVSEDTFRRLLAVPGEFEIRQTVRPLDGLQAEVALRRNERWMRATRNSSIIDQFETARHLATPGAEGHQRRFTHEAVILAYGDSPEAARLTLRQIQRVLADSRILSQRESDLAMPLWFQVLPTYDGLVRPCMFFTNTIAEMFLPDTPPKGLERCDFGSAPVLRFRTEDAGSYAFVPHISSDLQSPGHMLVIGDTGAGKTTLLKLLGTGALRYPETRVFVFDRRFSTLPWALAMGGDYLGIGSHIPNMPELSLAPFEREPSSATREHQLRLLRLMVKQEENGEHERLLRSIVSVLTDLPREHRTLLAAVEAAIPQAHPLWNAFRNWTDGPRRTLMASGHGRPVDIGRRLTVFDMTALLADVDAAVPVLVDIMARIFEAIGERGIPALIVLDEAPKLAGHPLFREEMIRLLDEGRSRRCAVALLAQRPDSFAHDPKLDSAIIAQTQTMLLAPNPKVPPRQWDRFHLSGRERGFVRGQSGIGQGLRRPFLLRKPKIPGESVIIETDAACLGPQVALLGDSQKHYTLATTLQAEYGADGWVDRFLQTFEGG